MVGKLDEGLSDELGQLEMARRYNESYGEKLPTSGKRKSEGDEEPAKKEEEKRRTLMLADVECMLEKKAPFQVDKKITDKLKKQVDKYKKEFMPECEKLFKAMPEVEEYEAVLKRMQEELEFVSPAEREILKTKKRHAFIMEKDKEYPVIDTDQRMKAIDSQSCKDDVPRFVSDFAKVARKFGKLKCQCPQAARLIEEYESAKKHFEALKAEYTRRKEEKSFDFINLAEFNEKLMFISLDFEQDELTLRQEIW